VTEEQVWINQAQHGDKEAFACLVEVYQTPVYNLCYRMLGEAEAAEDAAQETFLKAFQHLSQYDSHRPFATWLLSIAAHYCIDRLRRQRFIAFSLDDRHGDDENAETEWPDQNAPDPENETIRREEQRLIQRALQALEPTDRAAIILRYWHQASEAEIAETLQLSVPAVKSRLYRARHILARLWEQNTPAPKLRRKPYESPAF
jgi:RNA polymerase sigma-70 factor (ECF subfamily)